jgi:hypothetical protein
MTAAMTTRIAVALRTLLFAFRDLDSSLHASGGARGADLLGRGPEALCLNRLVGNPYPIAVGQLQLIQATAEQELRKVDEPGKG